MEGTDHVNLGLAGLGTGQDDIQQGAFFAAGDITDYPGKVRLIAVGFGEAATAVNNAAVVIDPSAHVFPGHSSEG